MGLDLARSAVDADQDLVLGQRSHGARRRPSGRTSNERRAGVKPAAGARARASDRARGGRVPGVRRSEPGAVLLRGVTAAAAAAVCRALFAAIHDGYLASGATRVACKSFARHMLADAAWTVLPSIALAALALALRERERVRLALSLGAIALAWSFLSGRLPASALHRIEFQTGSGRAANALALALSAALVAWLHGWPRPGARARGVLLAGALILVAAAASTRFVLGSS